MFPLEDQMATNVANIRRELSYDDKVIKKIVGIATDNVPGVLTVSGGLIGGLTDRLRSDDKTKGIDTDVGKRQVAVDLRVVAEYGRHVPDLYDAVVQAVSQAVTAMTGLDVVEVNMHVEDVLSKDDFETLRQKIGDENSAAGGSTGTASLGYTSRYQQQPEHARVQ